MYLGNLDPLVEKDDKNLLGIWLSANKKLLTRKWLLPYSPMRNNWLEIVKEMYLMEKLTFSCQLQREKCMTYSSKWVEHAKPLRSDFIGIQNDQ